MSETGVPLEKSRRQMETLRLVAQGLSYKEIAVKLGVAEVTIKLRMEKS